MAGFVEGKKLISRRKDLFDNRVVDELLAPFVELRKFLTCE